MLFFVCGSYPTIKLLHKNKVYDFEGERTKDSLVDWTLSIAGPGHQSMIEFPPQARPIPKPIGSWDLIVDSVAELGYDVETIAMKKPAACVLLSLIGFLLGVLTTLILLTFCLDTGTRPLIMTRNGKLVAPSQWQVNTYPGIESPPESPQPIETLGETLHNQNNSQTKQTDNHEDLSQSETSTQETELRQRK